MKTSRLGLCLTLASLLVLFTFTGCGNEKPAPAPVAAVEKSAERADAVKQIMVKSAVLGADMRVSVYLPPGYAPGKKYPVLYLLHGYSHTEANWFKVVETHLLADAMIASGKIVPLILVAPQYDNSGAVNSAEVRSFLGGDSIKTNVALGRYEDWLITELIPYIDANFGTIAAREGRFVGGQSMGGFAALHLGFKFPKLFSKVGGHMPNFLFRFPENMRSGLPSPYEVYEKSLGQPFDLMETSDLSGLSVYLDAGTEDRLKQWPDIQKMEGLLKAKGIKVETSHDKGDHSSVYVKSQLDKYLVFYAGK